MSLGKWFADIFAPEDVIYDGAADSHFLRRPTNVGLLRNPRTAPAREEFAAWRADPTTQFVMAALLRNADECADLWHQKSWVGGTADQRELDGLRERADTLRGIATADYEAFCETLQLEPETEAKSAA